MPRKLNSPVLVMQQLAEWISQIPFSSDFCHGWNFEYLVSVPSGHMLKNSTWAEIFKKQCTVGANRGSCVKKQEDEMR